MDEQKLLNKLNCFYGKNLNQELPQIILTADEACFLHAVVSVSLVRGVPNYFKDLEEKVAKLESLLLRFGSKKYPNGANGCCCLFDDDDNQIQWCAPHADLRDKVEKLEGWLKYLSKNYRQSIVEIEISDYIKAMEGKP